MSLFGDSRPDPRVLAFDTEVANRWWWYDGKSTERLMMFVGQWMHAGAIDIPFGWILLPAAIMDVPAARRQYADLPVISRLEGLRRIRGTIADADLLVGHNIRGFDVGVINGELMLLNEPLLPEVAIVDTLKDSRAKGFRQSRALGNRIARLEGPSAKPHVEAVTWEAAFNDFDPEALRVVWHRASTDVQLHVDLYRNDKEVGYL